jgi:predicted AlkP superfamily pyrophosphatase or phosphodiesterase
MATRKQVARAEATRQRAAMKRLLTALCLFACAFLAACSTPPRAAKGDLVILISIDGFRWDYLQRHAAPTLQALAAGGVRATRLNASFPTKTFPNHYTLVTGLYPQNHGIVANWFYDPADDAKFDMSKTEARWWQGGEPVWITAEKQGVRSACFFWPGSESEHDGVRPSLFKPFDKKLKAADRVDGLLAWLALPPAQRPRLATLYFDIVDDVGHRFGPLARETAAGVKEADDALARLLAGLERLGLRDSANLVLVSDHGMSETDPEQTVFLEDLMNIEQVRVEATGPYGGVRPKAGVDVAALIAGIRAKAPPQIKVYRREEMPERLHYGRGDSIPPILLIADDHWQVEQRSRWSLSWARNSKGNHGWDPATENMGALFVAHGPAFKRGAVIPAVDNIHVYNLLCALLGIKPAANDGDRRLARAALSR